MQTGPDIPQILNGGGFIHLSLEEFLLLCLFGHHSLTEDAGRAFDEKLHFFLDLLQFFRDRGLLTEQVRDRLGGNRLDVGITHESDERFTQ